MTLLRISVLVSLGFCGLAHGQSRPNIVFILADDMGYGDLKALNPDSRIPTPALDRLAQEGMRFTRAHSPASWCVPSRYGLLTGQYPHRTTWDIDKRSIIAPARLTLGRMLQQAGYRTGMVGKWHLGFDSANPFDCKTPLQGGPVDRGFHYFFGIHASLDIPPYFYIENRNCVAAPSGTIAAGSTPGWSPIQGAFWREGNIAPGFAHQDVQSVFLRKSVDFISGHRTARPQDPFFLYLALAGPHTPWLPPAPVPGNGAGLYGEYMAYMDQGVGRLLSALDSLGYSDNTLVFFSSDNGPVWYAENTAKFGHASGGPLRGMKLDAWEAGHRVPLLARWPGRIPAGAVSTELASLTDILATTAAILRTKMPDDAGEDSHNLLPALTNTSSGPPVREALVTSGGSFFTIQKGDWKLITGLGSGGFSSPKTVDPVAGGPRGQLYNLAADPGEWNNLWLQRKDIVDPLTALLDKYNQEGRSAPRSPTGLPPVPYPARRLCAPAGFSTHSRLHRITLQVPDGATRFSLHSLDGRIQGEWAVSPGSRSLSLPVAIVGRGLLFQRFRD